MRISDWSSDVCSSDRGEVVLMDCGTTVHGYQSDISRSFVYGKASARQRQVWDQMRKGQDVALAAAKLGTPAGKVDDAVRAYYESLEIGRASCRESVCQYV